MNTKKISQSLATFLADSYILYLKTQNFHWNIEGEGFYFLHKMFQEQYEDLAEAVDMIAERIRGLKEVSPGTMKQFLKLTNLKEEAKILNAKGMIKALLKDHETIIKTLGNKIKESSKEGDEGTADMYIERLRVHEKTAWILRSHL